MLTLVQLCNKKIFFGDSDSISREDFKKKFTELSKIIPAHLFHIAIPPSLVGEFLVPFPKKETKPYFKLLFQMKVLDLTKAVETGEQLNEKIKSIFNQMSKNSKSVAIREIIIKPEQSHSLLGPTPLPLSMFTSLEKITISPYGGPDQPQPLLSDSRIIQLANEGFLFTLPLTIISTDHHTRLRDRGFLSHSNIKFSQIEIKYSPMRGESKELLRLVHITENFFAHRIDAETFESKSSALRNLTVLSASGVKVLNLPNAVGSVLFGGARLEQFTAPYIQELTSRQLRVPHLNFNYLQSLTLFDCQWTFPESCPSEIYLPRATYVKIERSFDNLTSIIVPSAKALILDEMRSLNRIIAKKTTLIDLTNCPSLTQLEVGDQLSLFQASGSQIPSFYYSHLERISLINCFALPSEASERSLSFPNTKEIIISGGFPKLTHLRAPAAISIQLIGLISLRTLFAPKLENSYLRDCHSLGNFESPKEAQVLRVTTPQSPFSDREKIILSLMIVAFSYLVLSYIESLMQSEEFE